MEIFYYIIILLITGATVGFATGLLGVGGGFILVPIQFWLLESVGVDPTIALRIALGTSLAIIIPTAISGAYGHYRKKSVLIRPAIFLGLSGFLGGILGAIIATHTPGNILRVFFGLVLILVAIQMLIFKSPKIEIKPAENIFYYLFWGLIVGFMSGLLGIGGGLIMVPILIFIMRLNIREAIGTSTAVIIFTSLGGIISYILNGLNVQGLPSYSIGYVNILQFIILATISILMAQLGVYTAHKISENYLRNFFTILLILMGLGMLGIFNI
jgi:uncharacterized protein